MATPKPPAPPLYGGPLGSLLALIQNSSRPGSSRPGQPQQPVTPQTSYRQLPDGSMVEIGYNGDPVSSYSPEQMVIQNQITGRTPPTTRYRFDDATGRMVSEPIRPEDIGQVDTQPFGVNRYDPTITRDPVAPSYGDVPEYFGYNPPNGFVDTMPQFDVEPMPSLTAEERLRQEYPDFASYDPSQKIQAFNKLGTGIEDLKGMGVADSDMQYMLQNGFNPAMPSVQPERPDMAQTESYIGYPGDPQRPDYSGPTPDTPFRDVMPRMGADEMPYVDDSYERAQKAAANPQGLLPSDMDFVRRNSII